MTCEELQIPEMHDLTVAEDGADAEYFALSKRLGFRNAFIVRRELENVLRSEGVRVYDRAAVSKYMDGLVAKENARIEAEWMAKYPEYAEDYRRLISSREHFGMFTGLMLAPPPQHIHWGWQCLRKSDKGASLGGIYPHAVPYAALLTVERINAAFPGASFLVSNYAAVVPDPFLMVTHKLLDVEGYVIERWDEPGFRE